MSISRNTFDSAKNYKRVRYHQDRDLLDSELNEQQDITINEQKKIADLLFRLVFRLKWQPAITMSYSRLPTG